LRLRRVLLPAHIRKAAGEGADELWKFLEFAPAPPLGFAAKAGHALRHISLKPDALLLAGLADVDAGLFFFWDHMPDRFFHFGVEQRLVVVFARFALHQKLAQGLVARQAADMGGKNAVTAEDHDCAPAEGRAFIAQSACLGSMSASMVAAEFRRRHNVLRGLAVGSPPAQGRRKCSMNVAQSSPPL